MRGQALSEYSRRVGDVSVVGSSGHHVHWIQGIKSAGATVVIPVSVVVQANGMVQLRGDNLSLECWNHSPAAIQASLPRNPDHAVVWWKPQCHVAGRNLHRYVVIRAMRSVDDG